MLILQTKTKKTKKKKKEKKSKTEIPPSISK